MAKFVCVLLCLCLFQLTLCQLSFFPNQREERRYEPQFGFNSNFFPNPRRIHNTLTGLLHLRPETAQDNRGFIYPFNNRPSISNGPYNYDQYGRPYQNYQYQNEPNEIHFGNSNNQGNFGSNNQGFEQPPGGQLNNQVNFQRPTGGQEYMNYGPNEYPNNVQGGGVNFGGPQEVPNHGNNFGQPDMLSPQDLQMENPRNTTVLFPVSSSNDVNDGDKNGEKKDESSTEHSFGDRNGADDSKGFPTAPPPGYPITTKLPELAPVPLTPTRNNFNFGTRPLFRETCQTVEGYIGSCISILQCAPYVRLLEESQNNPTVVQVLRRAHCGFDGNNPKVCCPGQQIPSDPPPAPPSFTTTTTTSAPVTEAATARSLDPEDFVPSLPEPPVCGVSNASFSRVVGGIDAKLGDFPWMALLGYKRGDATRWQCGGSLITSKHVLTAAHCIHNHDNLYVVRVGELDLAREDEGATPVDVLVKKKIKHENYNPKSFTDDIGILVLDRDVQFTDLIKPICIPRVPELRSKSFENYTPIIAGWGDTDFRGPSATHLQALQLPVVSNDFCQKAYVQYKAQKIDERVLCAGYKAGGKDACQGDSGGPLMQPIWNSQDYTTHFYQIGVVSYGKECARAGFPGVYSRVTHFVPWIEQNVLGTVIDP